MNKILSLGIFCLAAILVFTTTGCEPEDPEFGNLNLTLSNLEDLGADFVYEGWLMVDGSPVSTGTFTVDADGVMSQSSFEIDYVNLQEATAFILSIEPAVDADPAPSNTKVLAGDFSGTSAALTIGDSRALGSDFATATGGYVIGTPTDGPASNEESGVWFMDPEGPNASLNIPLLGDGWTYEGWAVINGIPVSTGTFRTNGGADNAAPHSGPIAAPEYPGEDFLINAPAGLDFNPPPSLAGSAIVISVEPVPDNSPNPYQLKPLTSTVATDIMAGTLYAMDNAGESNHPRGAASR